MFIGGSLSTTIGDGIFELLGQAEYEVTIVAPFVKAPVLERVLGELKADVELVCVTRWHPQEIKAGVSDLGVWDVLHAQRHGRLFLIPTLHAKYYRGDGRYAIGSANLTNSGLGWSARPNVELVITGLVDSALQKWELGLLAQATEVDESLARYFRKSVDDLPAVETTLIEDGPEASELADVGPMTTEFGVESWLPTTRYPETLYEAYVGRADRMSTAAGEVAAQDLLTLRIPWGLDEDGFKAAVGATLLQMPLIHEIDRFLTRPRQFGVVREFLGTLDNYPDERDPAADWQTVMRWFQYFLSQRYKLAVPRHSEVVFKVE